MTFLSGTPVECTIHPTLWKDNFSNEPHDPDDDDDYEDDENILDGFPVVDNTTNYVRVYFIKKNN